MDLDSDSDRYSVIEKDIDVENTMEISNSDRESGKEEYVETSESEIVESRKSDSENKESDSENNKESEDNGNEASSDDSNDDVPLADIAAVLAATQARQVRFKWPEQTKQWTRPINSRSINEVYTSRFSGKNQ